MMDYLISSIVALMPTIISWLLSRVKASGDYKQDYEQWAYLIENLNKIKSNILLELQIKSISFLTREDISTVAKKEKLLAMIEFVIFNNLTLTDTKHLFLAKKQIISINNQHLEYNKSKILSLFKKASYFSWFAHSLFFIYIAILLIIIDYFDINAYLEQFGSYFTLIQYVIIFIFALIPQLFLSAKIINVEMNEWLGKIANNITHSH